MSAFLLISQLAVSWALFGLIWTIQLVHYPSFHFVQDFEAFHSHHTQNITLVVGPLMLLEMGLSIRTALQGDWFWIGMLCIVILIWILTFFWAVPLHEKLAAGKDTDIIDQLIRANWPRTLLWTAKAAAVTWTIFSQNSLPH